MSETSGYPTIREDEQLQAIASPVNTFVPTQAIQVYGQNRLTQLADALRPISSDLRQWAYTRAVKENEAERLKGEQAFIANNSEGYADAVKAGHIPSYASPSFVSGYKRAQGDVAGTRLGTQFHADFLAWPDKDSADPASFDSFFGNFLKQNVTTTDPDILRGLEPHIRALHSDASTLFNHQLDLNTYTGSLNTYLARGAQMVDSANLMGIGSPTGTDYQKLASDLMTSRANADATGIRGDDWDKGFIDMVGSKAIDLRDPQLLTLLDQKVPGTEIAYKDLPHGRDVKLSIEEKLASLATAEEGRLATRLEREHKEGVRKSEDSIIQWLFAHPEQPIPDATLSEARKWDPTLPVRALDWQEKILHSEVQESDSALAQVQKDVLTGGGPGAVLRAIDNGTIRAPATIRTLYDWAQARQKDGANADILKGSVVENYRKTIKSRTTPSDLLKDDLFGNAGLTNEGLRLMSDYEIRLLDWARLNPNAGPIEKMKAQNEIGGLVLQGINGGDASRAPTTVDRTPEAGNLDPNNLPMQAMTNTPQAERDFNAFVSGIDPDTRKTVHTEALKRGMTDQQVLYRWWDMSKLGSVRPSIKPPVPQAQSQEAPAPTVTVPLPPPVPEQHTETFPETHTQPLQSADAGSDLKASIPGQPVANKLLDFIAKVEAPLGYNQRHGEVKPQSNLTAETLKSLMANASGSTAAGRYQILASTLKDLTKQLGVSDGERFTPAMQDRMAHALLKDAGLDEYLNGKMSVTSFANALAQTWDSLPLVSGRSRGKTYADRNKDALVGAGEFMDLLRSLRS